MNIIKFIYLLIKSILLVIGSFAIHFVIFFNLISEEKLAALIKENFWSFFNGTFLLGLVVGLIFYFFSILTNYLFRNKLNFTKKRLLLLALIEFIYIVLFSLVLTLMFISID